VDWHATGSLPTEVQALRSARSSFRGSRRPFTRRCRLEQAPSRCLTRSCPLLVRKNLRRLVPYLGSVVSMRVHWFLFSHQSPEP